MPFFIDNLCLKKLIENPAAEVFSNFSDQLNVDFYWPSLLTFLEEDKLFDSLPSFGAQHPLFQAIFSALTDPDIEKSALISLYDQLFVENLTWVKTLPQTNVSYLLDGLRKKRAGAPFILCEALDKYNVLLQECPQNAMHDLILYLAWDRVCVCFAILFDYHEISIPAENGLFVFRECLLESFQHITALGRTSPGFFRLLEALYAYQMREEKLQAYPEEEWLILCRSSAMLRPREKLSDVYYIDAAICETEKLPFREPLNVFTSDSTEKIKASNEFAAYTIEQLKKEKLPWHYSLQAADIAQCVISD
jgi:hypothetical protein